MISRKAGKAQLSGTCLPLQGVSSVEATLDAGNPVSSLHGDLAEEPSRSNETAVQDHQSSLALASGRVGTRGPSAGTLAGR